MVKPPLGAGGKGYFHEINMEISRLWVRQMTLQWWWALSNQVKALLQGGCSVTLGVTQTEEGGSGGHLGAGPGQTLARALCRAGTGR